MQFFPENIHRQHIDHLLEHRRLTLSGVGNLSAKVFFLNEVMMSCDPSFLGRSEDGFFTLLWVIEDVLDAKKVYDNFKFWSSIPVENFFLSEQETLSDLDKMLLLYRISDSDRKAIILQPQSLLVPMPSLKDIKNNTISLSEGMSFDRVEIINNLLRIGYEFSADEFLKPGTYCQRGGLLNVFVPTMSSPLKIELDAVTIAALYEYDQASQRPVKKHSSVDVVPLKFDRESSQLIDYLSSDVLILEDEVDMSPKYDDKISDLYSSSDISSLPAYVQLTAFPEEEDKHYYYLYYLSILKFQDVHDFLNDLREKQRSSWKVVIYTKHFTELKGVLDVEKMRFATKDNIDDSCFLYIENLQGLSSENLKSFVPESFQNPDLKIAFLTDREIFDFRQIRRKETKMQRKVNLEFLQSLNEGDYVVHVDHGIGKFMGIEQQLFDSSPGHSDGNSGVGVMTKEYLKIEYADNDKLYVPIDQAEKVNKYVGIGNAEPRLTRLGSSEWSTVTNKVKKESEKIAKELLMLYSKREMAKGFSFMPDDNVQEQFENTFPYNETPGQLRAIMDVKKDMESKKPMDRLIVGDVGFGKTEVALRAAFKAVRSGKQVAVITPITILTDQHFKEFQKRMSSFDVRIEMLSRFRSVSEQKKIMKMLHEGGLDIIIGTHRLLQPDVLFKDLGLLIIDEEQRFGVKQKERLKELRASVDILTLTATPIPRTLNMSLNKLRDITIITTPPSGRLPIITEVRRFSEVLIKEAIDREISRSGQVYFLHNRVQTIDSMADKLRNLFPDLRIIVAHGKLKATELEERIMAFKAKQYDVLVSSTIIENGIDLPNANTMIINNADQFGLSQLYQLRGRIGRGKVQAYAYFLYHSQKLQPDAKRRLRAIVEANELGAGFQIAMHDLEIRGAGDVLGVSQSGAISVVGVSHFVRLLQQMVAELKSGKVVTQELEDLEKITIDLPITAFIPDQYVPESREKINAYQRLSSATRLDSLNELQQEFVEDYGKLPDEVKNLFKVLELKIMSRNADIIALRSLSDIHGGKEIILTMGKNMKPEQIMKLLEKNPQWRITGTSLKIDMKKLGFKWSQGLRESLFALKREQKKVKVSKKLQTTKV